MRLQREIDREERDQPRRDAGARRAGHGKRGHAVSNSIRPSRARPCCAASPSGANTAVVGAGHEGLGAEVDEHLEQRLAAGLVEMGGDLVEEDHGRLPGHVGDEAGLGEDEADEQRLLLSGRAGFRRHVLGAMADEEVGAVRADQRPPGHGVALAVLAEELPVALLDLARGEAVEVALEAARRAPPRRRGRACGGRRRRSWRRRAPPIRAAPRRWRRRARPSRSRSHRARTRPATAPREAGSARASPARRRWRGCRDPCRSTARPGRDSGGGRRAGR